MTKRTTATICILLSFMFCFTCIGYASLTTELTVTGSATVEPIVQAIDYLYVSSAKITSGSSADTVIKMSGSSDYSNPMGWVTLKLDFTESLTKTFNVSITNAGTSNYSFKSIACEVVDGSDASVQLTPVITSGLEAGTLNSEGYVVGGTSIAPTQSIENILITVTASEAITTTVSLQFLFGFPGEADKEEAENKATVSHALEKLKIALNNENTYNEIIDEMSQNTHWGGDGGGNYVGNVLGAQSSDTELIEAIFGDTLTAVTFEDNTDGQTCTVMIKHEDITDINSSYETVNIWGFTYEREIPLDEMTLYMTTQNPSDVSSGTYISVYAVVFIKDKDTGVWSQYGDIYKGEASTNAYEAGTGNTSFDTGTWRALGDQIFTIVVDNETKTYSISDNDSIEEVIQAYESTK